MCVWYVYTIPLCIHLHNVPICPAPKRIPCVPICLWGEGRKFSSEEGGLDLCQLGYHSSWDLMIEKSWMCWALKNHRCLILFDHWNLEGKLHATQQTHWKIVWGRKTSRFWPPWVVKVSMHDLSLFTSGFARSNDFYLQYAAYRVLHAVSQFKKG